MTDGAAAAALSPGGAPLLTASEIRALARRLGVRPTKTLGQNFLVDPNTIRRIVRTAQVAPDDVALEVGPGLGSLTLGLVAAAREVIAVEIDPVLAAELPQTVAAKLPDRADRLHVAVADAVTVRGLPGAPPTVLVANLPYNVAVPVLLHVLATLPTVRHGVVMVQAEVAARLTASPGSRAYGAPTVKANWYATLRPAGAIPRAVFWPVPNVDSALVAFERHPPPAGHPAEVFRVVDAAFAQRRKTLRAALAGWAGGPDRAEQRLRAARLDPASRGETLRVADFARLAAADPAIAARIEGAQPGAGR